MSSRRCWPFGGERGEPASVKHVRMDLLKHPHKRVFWLLRNDLKRDRSSYFGHLPGDVTELLMLCVGGAEERSFWTVAAFLTLISFAVLCGRTIHRLFQATWCP